MRRKLPPWLIDVGITVVVAWLAVISITQVPPEALEEYRPLDLFAYLLTTLQILPLLARRRAPVAALAVAGVAWMVDRGLGYPASAEQAALPILLHAVGAYTPPRRSAIVGGGAVAVLVGWTLVGWVTSDVVGVGEFLWVLFLTSIPLLFGREVYQRRRRIETLEERAERAEREREEQARRAVEEERTRIARELHDVIAHQVSVMTLQAEGAGRLAADADPRIRDALATIRDAGHQALEEMRRMVGLLRTSDEDAPPPPDLAPQPGLDRIESLVSWVQDSGLDARLEVAGEPRPLPSGVELNAYRIVQESLTNALRHAGPDVRAVVTLRYTDDALQIEVADDGRGSAVPAGVGHGIVGMRERAAMLHGTLEAGPRPGGGFRVRATLPVGS